MSVAVTIPPAASAAELAESLALAAAAGADAAVLAEAPLGAWASAPAGAAFAAGRSPLPLGVVLDARDRHPLALWEQIAVLQRIAGPGLWPLLAGWGEGVVRAHEALAPRPLPFAVAPWLVASDEHEAALARSLDARCVAPPGVAADMAWGNVDALAAGAAAPLLVTIAPERFAEDLHGVRALKRDRMPSPPWMGIATERFAFGS